MQNEIWPPVVPKRRSLLNATRFIHNPIPILSSQMEEYGDTYTFYMGGMKKSIVTADADFIQHVLQKKHRNYEKSYIQTETLAEYIGKGLLTAEGEYWLQQRRLIQPGFNKAKLTGLMDIMTSQVDKTFDALERKINHHGHVDIYEEMRNLTFRIVAKSLFSTSINEAGVEMLSHQIETIQSFIVREVRQPFFHWWFQLSGKIKKHLRLARKTQSFIQDIIDQRRRSYSRTSDLLDMLIDAKYEDGSGMTDKQLLDESLILFVAGHETSANAMAWTLHLLSQHPRILSKLQHEIQSELGDQPPGFEDLKNLQYTRQVIEESMRLYPPAWVSDRVSVVDDEICGFRFPKGTIIILYFYGLHHNPHYWESPETFDPERFTPENRKKHKSYAYVPFGGGPRLCIGNHFAIMEMQLILIEFVRRFEFAGMKNEIELQPLITLKPRGGVPMRIKYKGQSLM